MSAPDDRPWLARRIPERWRTAHRLYATSLGYFWRPCPTCRQDFGGHEWTYAEGWAAVPHPSGEPYRSTGICPRCTRAGKGRRGEWAHSRGNP